MLSCFGTAVAGQAGATLSMGGSIVEYDGFLASAAATITPALRFDARSLSLGGQAGWTVFESGNQVLQATAAAAWLTPPRQRWAVELSGAAGAFRYADEPGSGHALARARLHYAADRNGAWIGATSGATFNGSIETPVEIAVGAWSIRERFAVVGTVTGTRLGTDHHLDIAAAAKWTGTRLQLEARGGARPFVKNAEGVGDALTGVWGEVSALVPLGARISLALSGGTYPSDPVRRVLGARYVTAGVRLAIFEADRSPPLTIPAALVAAVRNHSRAETTSRARLEILPTVQLHTVRVHAPGATSVELMADFTDWRSLTLTQDGDGIWATQLPLTPGVHRVNIRIDGGAWLVPTGARPEQDEFGGVVGVVVVH
jgi:hypothetical protein